MVNNIRDIATDKESGKNTIAVRLGAKLSRRLFIWDAVDSGADKCLVGFRFIRPPSWAF